jgi:adenylosuccinate synthase
MHPYVNVYNHCLTLEDALRAKGCDLKVRFQLHLKDSSKEIGYVCIAGVDSLDGKERLVVIPNTPSISANPTSIVPEDLTSDALIDKIIGWQYKCKGCRHGEHRPNACPEWLASIEENWTSYWQAIAEDSEDSEEEED